MLGEERWDLVEGFGFREKNLYSDFVFHAPSVLSLGWILSQLITFRTILTGRVMVLNKCLLFFLLTQPPSCIQTQTCFFLGMDVFLISQHAEHQACQGNKGSNFAKLFLWFEAGCTCLNSPAHTEGGVRDAGWFCQFRHALLKQFKSWIIPDPFLLQKLFMYLLFWKVFGWVSI